MTPAHRYLKNKNLFSPVANEELADKVGSCSVPLKVV